MGNLYQRTKEKRESLLALTINPVSDYGVQIGRPNIPETQFHLRIGWAKLLWRDLRIDRAMSWKKITEITGFSATMWRNILASKWDNFSDESETFYHVTDKFISSVMERMMDLFEFNLNEYRSHFEKGFRVSSVIDEVSGKFVGCVFSNPEDSVVNRDFTMIRELESEISVSNNPKLVDRNQPDVNIVLNDELIHVRFEMDLKVNQSGHIVGVDIVPKS